MSMQKALEDVVLEAMDEFPQVFVNWAEGKGQHLMAKEMSRRLGVKGK
jgi:hypothetical protein